MAVLGRNSRLLLDYYLVSSDTMSIDFELTREEEDAPTHENPRDFLPRQSYGVLTLNGYVSVNPNTFVLEKRLHGVFDDPDGTHYFAFIPDFESTGWNPVYTGTIKSADVQVQSAAKGVITINGSARTDSYFRPTLGENYDSQRAVLLYYNPAVALTTAYAYGSYIDLGTTYAKGVFVVVTFDQVGSEDILMQFTEATSGAGAGDAEIFASPLEHDSGDNITVDLSEAVTKQFLRFGIKTEANTDTVGIAAWFMGAN
jgi:hypothetical protein